MKIRLLFIAYFPVALCFGNKPLFLPSDSLHRHDTLLREVVVTAYRTATDRFTTPEAITVLKAGQIAGRLSRTTPEALQHLPGVWIQKTNHGGGSPFLRGLTGNQTLILVDGIRLNNGTFRYGPNQYFNTIDVFTVRRIEVMKGSGSVQYGSDALGGVVQIFTTEPAFADTGAWSGSLLGRIASQGMEYSGRAAAGYSGRKVAVLGGLNYRDFGDLRGGDTTGFQRPSGYRELDADLKMNVRLKPGLVLTAAHQNVGQHHVPVYHKVQLENFALNEMDSQRHSLSYLGLSGEPVAKGRLKQYTLTAAWQYSKEDRNSRKNGSTVVRREEDQVHTAALIAETGWSFWRNGRTVAGAEWYADQVRSTRTDTDQNTGAVSEKRGLYPDDSRMHSLAAFCMNEWSPGPWTLTGGVRFNAYRIDLTEETLEAVRLKPRAFVWNAAVQRTLAPGWLLLASANTTFRAPNIDDLGSLGIVDFRYELPNYDLAPERSLNLQLGAKWQKKGVEAELFVFDNHLKNLIARVRVPGDSISGYPVYQKENTEKARIRGLEASLRLPLAQNWTLEYGMAYTYGQNDTRNEPVRRIPPLNGRLAIRWARGPLALTAETLAAAKQTRLAQDDKDDNRIPAGGTPGWTVFNLYSGWTKNAWSLQLGAQNLLNRDYRYHGSGVNGVGHSLWLGVEWRFG